MVEKQSSKKISLTAAAAGVFVLGYIGVQTGVGIEQVKNIGVELIKNARPPHYMMTQPHHP